MIGEALSFGLVGLANTAVGLLVIFGCMAFAGTSPLVSNAIGYGFGLGVSFLLNGRFTFRQSRLFFGMLTRFLSVCALSYAANAACVGVLAARDKYAAQIAGVAIYAALSFVLCRVFVFRERRDSAR